ncbi:phosphate/phosphite/phosphonate ABC transporter substrate-binding protein [Tuwongella immobilis]|uniref:: Phosphonate-bd n=1 Tax=Tuwongella immobilis TaxID=692036 RepID=A0A6C2YN21_9BACT|nr:PhnD/SsuA/transferrin family substrate-binding protein [Tuwongella immobilis]VIP02302.1 : Phosphonate-bd [Tuwongella immobilis]VTS00992.1 : Phosphonate-bd [Tuwongella immobilis]
MMRASRLAVAALCLAVGPLALPSPAQEAIPVSRSKEAANQLRIGIMENMFRDLPRSLVFGVSKPFEQLLTAHTGMNGSMNLYAEADEMARKIRAGELELGVFHGYEFAWMKQKHPELEPLVVAVPMYRKSYACIVVGENSNVTCMADLAGKSVAMPNGVKEFARLYFDRGCNCETGKIKFDKVTNPLSTEDALDDVVDGIVDACVVDATALQSFANRKSGRYKRLKIACESIHFPMTVIACKKGSLSDTLVTRIKAGLTSAQSTAQGRTMMGLWKLAGFEAIPGDFEAQLQRTLKQYPAPAKN